jgi:hypothetical protein
MVWHEPQNDFNGCYLCISKIFGYNKKDREGIQDPSLSLAIRPVPHGPDILIPTPLLSQTEISTRLDAEEEEEKEEDDDDDVHFSSDMEIKNLHPLNQLALNGLVHDLGFD